MPVMCRREFGILVGLVIGCFTLSMAQGSIPPQRSRPDALEDWVDADYEVVLKRLLPERLSLVPFPKSVRWVAVVQIHDASHASEYWFSVKANYDGGVEATVRVPRGGSLAHQMRELRQKLPHSSLESLSEMLQIDEYKITDRDLPDLKDLAQAFEAIRMSPVMPDFLMLDSYGYHVWSESQYGQEMSVDLVGPGPDASKQPHVLVEWAEKVRGATQRYVREPNPHSVSPSALGTPRTPMALCTSQQRE